MADGNNQPTDTISRSEYNKIVESHNSMKLEKEKIENELKTIKETKSEDVNKMNVELAEWKSYKENIDNQLAELKKKAEDNKPVAKGIVPTQAQAGDYPPEISKAKALLDRTFPERKANPERYGSAIQRYGYYKNGTTKAYTDEQLGMGLSLLASAQRLNPDMIAPELKKSSSDILI